jgi:hypothetical protein
MFSAPDFSRGPRQLIRRFLADGAGEGTEMETAIQFDRAAVPKQEQKYCGVNWTMRGERS